MAVHGLLLIATESTTEMSVKIKLPKEVKEM